MPYLLVRHKVQDYAKWKPGFDEHGAVRKASSSKGGLLFRNADDPNELVILLEFEDLDRAREFARSDDLRDKMRQVGVVDQPYIYFLEEADRPPV